MGFNPEITSQGILLESCSLNHIKIITMEGTMTAELKETVVALTAGILMSLVVCWTVSMLTS
jgi:hypothetical protein